MDLGETSYSLTSTLWFKVPVKGVYTNSKEETQTIDPVHMIVTTQSPIMWDFHTENKDPPMHCCYWE